MAKSVSAPKKLTIPGIAIAAVLAAGGYYFMGGSSGPSTTFVGSAAAAGELDTGKLPRVAGAKETYVSGPTTILISPESVVATADATAKALAADGWQPYEAPFTAKADGPDIKLMTFKKGPHGLNVMISVAPAQGNQTAVHYTALAYETDLPFPKDATAIEFSPDRPYLSLQSTEAVEPLMAFFEKEMIARGWSPWSVDEQARKPDTAAKKNDNGLFSFLVRDGKKPLIVLVQRYKDGSTHAKIEVVPEALLKPQKKEEVVEAPVSAPDPSVQKMNDAFDQLAGEIMNEARKATSEAIASINKKPEPKPETSAEAAQTLNALSDNTALIPLPETADSVEVDGAAGTLDFKSSSSVRAVASFYRKAMKPLGWKERPTVIDKDNMVALSFSKGEESISITVMKIGTGVNVSATGSGLRTEAAEADESAATSPDAPASNQVAEKDLGVQEIAGLPVPTPNTLNGSEKSLYRLKVNARVSARVDSVLAFYRRELAKLSGWKENQGAVVEPGHAVVSFATNDGPATLTLDHDAGETVVALVVRKEAEAKKAGMLPKPGNVKLLFGNVLEGEASVTIDKKTVKIAAGLGGKKPDGPTLEIAPGKHKFSFKLPGQAAQTDEVEVAAGDIWGLVIGPGGVLALPMY